MIERFLGTTSVLCKRITLSIFVVLATALPIWLSGAGVANADEDTDHLDRRAAGVYQQIFSPFCPGRSLNDCPSSKAHELKEEIREKLKSGVPSDDILTEVFAKFGDQYRAVPPNVGFGRLVWLAPIGFVTFGLLLALFVAKRKKVIAPVADSRSKAEISLSMRELIDKELDNID